MLFKFPISAIIGLLLTTDSASSAAIPASETEIHSQLQVLTMSNSTRNPITTGPQAHYGRCGRSDVVCLLFPNFQRDCDILVNEILERNDKTVYRSNMPNDGDPIPGAPRKLCRASSVVNSGCGIQINGPESCQRTGNQIWWDYNYLQECNAHGICGALYWAKEGEDEAQCSTTVEFMANCHS